VVVDSSDDEVSDAVEQNINKDRIVAEDIKNLDEDVKDSKEDMLVKMEDSDLEIDLEDQPLVEPRMPTDTNFSHIKNKQVRSAKGMKLMKEKRKEKKAARVQRRKEGIEPEKPHTIESLREKDETTIDNIEADEHEEAKKDMEVDEMAAYYENSYAPKVLITFSDNPLRKTRIFGKELTRIIPNSEYRFRRRSAVKKIVKSAIANEYTDIVIVNEDQKQPNGFLLIHLPNGPTAHFKLTNCKITKEMKKNYREISHHRPEVILNNFTTRLGHTVGRMLGALFHYEPEFKGRRAVTFHNQRDYIFFRHHRYEFTKDGKRAKLRELGPRFTLKLISVQQGTFDSKHGDYEWLIQGRRHLMETSRRKFFL